MDPKTLIKELYDFEIERKDKLDSNVGTLLTAVSGIIVSMIFILRDNEFHDANPNKDITLIMFACCSFVLAVSIMFMLSAYHHRGYKYIGFSVELDEYYKNLLAHHDGDHSSARRDFSDDILTQIAEYGTHNARENDRKSEAYYQSRQWLAWSLLPFACGAVSYAHFLFSLE